jgi:hypothetical protein
VSRKHKSTRRLTDKDNVALINMMFILMKDVNECYDHMETVERSGKKGRYFWRRIFVRSVFAAIEGACECLRRQAFTAEVNKVPKQIFLAKLSVLAGETYYVTSKGEIRAQPLRIRFLDHVLLSLKSYAEAQGVRYRTSKGKHWQRIQKALQVRHRVTHPKRLSALTITKAEIGDIDFVFKWFSNELGCIMREKGIKLPTLL